MFLTAFKIGSKTFYVQSATVPANHLRNPRRVTSRKWIRLLLEVLANISFGATNHAYKVVQLWIFQKLLSCHNRRGALKLSPLTFCMHWKSLNTDDCDNGHLML